MIKKLIAVLILIFTFQTLQAWASPRYIPPPPKEPTPLERSLKSFSKSWVERQEIEQERVWREQF